LMWTRWDDDTRPSMVIGLIGFKRSRPARHADAGAKASRSVSGIESIGLAWRKWWWSGFAICSLEQRESTRRRRSASRCGGWFEEQRFFNVPGFRREDAVTLRKVTLVCASSAQDTELLLHQQSNNPPPSAARRLKSTQIRPYTAETRRLDGMSGAHRGWVGLGKKGALSLWVPPSKTQLTQQSCAYA